MISYDFFYKAFIDWYFANKSNANEENANTHLSDMLCNAITICYDDIYEDEEVVITKVLRCSYINSTETISGHTQIFEWMEIKLGIKDEYSNIVRCKNIGYQL